MSHVGAGVEHRFLALRVGQRGEQGTRFIFLLFEHAQPLFWPIFHLCRISAEKTGRIHDHEFAHEREVER